MKKGEENMSIQKVNSVSFTGYMHIRGYKDKNIKQTTEVIDTSDIINIGKSEDYSESIITYYAPSSKGNRTLRTLLIDNTNYGVPPSDRHFQLLKAYTAACQKAYVKIEV